MSVEPTQHHVHHTDRARRTAPQGPPAGASSSASLAAGAVAALVLTLVVFAGAHRGVITGVDAASRSALGWALMAVAVRPASPAGRSAGPRSRPPRWAPPGLALVVFAPATTP